jgi:hypothetical protein
LALRKEAVRWPNKRKAKFVSPSDNRKSKKEFANLHGGATVAGTVTLMETDTKTGDKSSKIF